MIKISVINRSVRLVCDNDPITTGSVGYPVSFSFSDEWGGLAKTAVFYGSGVRRDVALINSTETTIPHEVLTEAGTMLRIGVYGALPDGTIVMPTVIIDVSRIKQGAKPSEIDPEAPTPSWVAEVQNAAADALEKAEAVEDAAERGDFDGVSPDVTVTTITGGHRVTITDADGDHTFDVMDGNATLFVAKAGITAYADILQALLANKVCVAIDGFRCLLLDTVGYGAPSGGGASANYVQFSIATKLSAGTQLEFIRCFSTGVWDRQNAPVGTYSKPAGGIPASDLAPGVAQEFWFGTRAEYNALPSIDPAVCYCIEEGT